MAKAKTTKKSTDKKKSATTKPARQWPVLLITGGFGVIILVVVLLQIFTIAGLSRKVDSLNQSMGGVIDEVGTKLSVADQLEMFANDINELRAYLYLPPKEYAFTQDETTDSAEETSLATRANQGLFAVMKDIHQTKVSQAQKESARSLLVDIQLDRAIQENLTDTDLTVAPTITEEGHLLALDLLTADGQVFARLVYHGDTNEWEIWDFAQSEFYDDTDTFKTALNTYLYNLSARLDQYQQYLARQTEVQNYLAAPEVKELLTEKSLTVDNLVIKNSADEALAQIMIGEESGNIIWLTDGSAETVFTDLTEFESEFPDLIAGLDTRTQLAKAIAEKQVLISDLMADPAFQTVLSDYDLTIATAPLEEDDRLYYPITDSDGNVLKQIVIEKNESADLLVVDADGLNAQKLTQYSLTDGSKKK